MTKVIILGEAQGAEPEKKKIEFVKYFDPVTLLPTETGTNPATYKNIELISRNKHDGDMDIMFAYNSDRNHGILYLGKFNDGIV